MLFVFMSQPDFACNPYALYKYISENTEHETAWLVKRANRYEELLTRDIRCAIYDTQKGNELIKGADYVIMNSYTFSELPKTDNQIFVNLWHGSGIKAHDFYNHEMSNRQADKLKNYFGKVDLMCLQSLDDRFRLSAMLHYDLRKCYVTGQARLDCVKKSDGIGKLKELYGDVIDNYSKFLFYAPTFRVNASGHSGKIFSDNIFRLEDFDSEQMDLFLEKHNALLIYKLHPIEQTAFSNRKFTMGKHCMELTEDMLFNVGIQYTEILNVFDVMISDYSSIAYDFLLLDRPIVYLIPDYEEYVGKKGFVFHNIDAYMPGEKAFTFSELLAAMEEGLCFPEKHKAARRFVVEQRFDYDDDKSSERCYKQIIGYTRKEEVDSYFTRREIHMPSVADHLRQYLDGKYRIVDSTSNFSQEDKQSLLNSQDDILYIMSEREQKYRGVKGQSSVDIQDQTFYEQIREKENVRVEFVEGGVDFCKFSDVEGKDAGKEKRERKRLGFAGTIDNRIFFSMVQCICEVFSDCDIIFAGGIYGEFPAWFNDFENLHYIEAEYDELPAVISSFDIALLPFFGRHGETVPTEFFQYLAAGKQVVASNMVNLPLCKGVYISESTSSAIENIREAMNYVEDKSVKYELRNMAKQYDWKIIAGNVLHKCLVT